MTTRTYSSPEAFKQALEQRLRSATQTGGEFARRRQLLVFDRFLARIVAVLGDAATLKGGLVLELRLERARTTKDIDLRLMDSPDDILAKLQEAGRRNLGDFMTFEVGPDDDRPEIQNDGMQYDGKTHPLPMSVPTPSPAWESPYAAMAREDQLAWATLGDVTKAVQSFLDPLLEGGLDATWNPTTWGWGAHEHGR
jgi:hypothetical protein